jgi:hypothetical protein
MGCANSTKLTEEMQHLQAELDSTKRSLQVTTELKEAFSLELSKRRPQENEDDHKEGSASLSDSLRDEWNKVKEWVETEVQEGNDVFVRLQRLVDLEDSSEEARDMRKRTQRVVDSNYDADLLVDFSLRRSRVMKTLLDKATEDRSQLLLHLKVVEEQLKAMMPSYEGARTSKDLQDKLASFRSGQAVDKVKTVSAFLRAALETQSIGEGSKLRQLEERFEDLKRSDESKARELNAKMVQIRHLETQLKEKTRAEGESKTRQLETDLKMRDMEINQLKERIKNGQDELEAKRMLETEVEQLRLALQIAKSSQDSGNQVEWLQSQLLESQVTMKSQEEDLAIKAKTIQLKDAKLAQIEARLKEVARQKQLLEEDVRGLEAGGEVQALGAVKKTLKDLSTSIDKGFSE